MNGINIFITAGLFPESFVYLDMSAKLLIVFHIKLNHSLKGKILMADIIRAFMEHTKTLDTENFIRSMLLCFAAPTIKSIKSACLINFRRREDEDMRTSWKAHADEWLSPLGLEWLLLNERGKFMNALVLVYRRELLTRVLRCEKACDILADYGYPLHDVDACLECLRRKFCFGCPHEVGLFLGYPPEDVRGFIEGRKSKSVSCPYYWKVYGDTEKAGITFRKYKQAEYDAAREILAGR